MENPFLSAGTAAQYAVGRPFYHPLVVERIRGRCGSVGVALDVACGTGLSTVALRAMAAQVIGCDIARAMLAHAPRQAHLQYARAAAERLPIASRSLDLVCVWSAFHWFDRSAFLREVHRVLRPGGWLAITSDGFGGRMRGQDGFADWNQQVYTTRFPTPPRPWAPLDEPAAQAAGVVLQPPDHYEREQAFTRAGLVEYLLTQSNISTGIDAGRETIASARAWLEAQLQPFVPTGECWCAFHGPIWYARRPG